MSFSSGLNYFSASNAGAKTSVGANAASLFGWQLLNTTGAVAYVQIFDKVSANVTVGTTAPDLVIGLAANGQIHAQFIQGIPFVSGITIACTTTRNGATGAAVECLFLYD